MNKQIVEQPTFKDLKVKSVSNADIELYSRTEHILNNVLGLYSNAMLIEESKDKPDNKLITQYYNLAKDISSAKRFIVEATPKEQKLIAAKYAKIYREDIERKKKGEELFTL